MCHARLERAASAVSSGASSPHTPQPQRDHGTHFSLPTRPRLAQRVVCVLPPSLVVGLWFRVPLVERFVHPRLNGSFNSSTERLVGGKLLKQFSYQVSVCLLSDGIGGADFVRRKAAVIFVGNVARSLQIEKSDGTRKLPVPISLSQL